MVKIGPAGRLHGKHWVGHEGLEPSANGLRERKAGVKEPETARNRPVFRSGESPSDPLGRAWDKPGTTRGTAAVSRRNVTVRTVRRRAKNQVDHAHHLALRSRALGSGASRRLRGCSQRARHHRAAPGRGAPLATSHRVITPRESRLTRRRRVEGVASAIAVSFRHRRTQGQLARDVRTSRRHLSPWFVQAMVCLVLLLGRSLSSRRLRYIGVRIHVCSES
jgi:hypothetical protein